MFMMNTIVAVGLHRKRRWLEEDWMEGKDAGKKAERSGFLLMQMNQRAGILRRNRGTGIDGGEEQLQASEDLLM